MKSQFLFNTKIIPCLFCGGGKSQDSHIGDIHTDECPLRWHHEYEECITLRLNKYQAANLLRTLQLIWEGKIQVPNGGDWYGEIPNQLGAKMNKAGWENCIANDNSIPAATKMELLNNQCPNYKGACAGVKGHEGNCGTVEYFKKHGMPYINVSKRCPSCGEENFCKQDCYFNRWSI